MLTGEFRSQGDAIWNAFWSGGIANPTEVTEQITNLLFQRRLDDLHTLEERMAIRLGKPIERCVDPSGADAKRRDCLDLRWSCFKNFAPAIHHAALSEFDTLFASLQHRAFAGAP
jgi:type I restriction enzyme M protein